MSRSVPRTAQPANIPECSRSREYFGAGSCSTYERNISMNLGQAVAVCLYEVIREERSIPEPKHDDTANGQQRERISGVLIEALLAAGSTNSDGRSATEEKVRRLVYRLNLSSADAELLLGMLRHVWRGE